MAKVGTYHSVDTNDPQVHHDHDDCTSGRNILPQNRRSGTGGYPRCGQCQRMD